MVAQLDKNYIKLSKEKALKRFVSYLFFEGRPHSTAGQWFNPVVFFVLKMLARFTERAPLDRPIFIVGLGRSGTTVLGLVMSMHKELAYLNEPKAIWSLIDERTDTVDDYVQSKGELNLDATHLNDRIAARAIRIFSNYLRLVGRGRLLDKFPEHIFRVDYLLSIFPDAKIIFISRSGIDAVASIAKWTKDHKIGDAENIEDWWGRNDAKWQYICQQVLTLQPYKTALGQVDLANINQINRAALEWIITMDRGLDAINKHGEKILHVQYESLIKEPELFIESLFDYCELDNDRQVLEYVKSKIYQQREKPPPELLEPIARLFSLTQSRLDEQINN